jgi:hypothetical protein
MLGEEAVEHGGFEVDEWKIVRSANAGTMLQAIADEQTQGVNKFVAQSL